MAWLYKCQLQLSPTHDALLHEHGVATLDDLMRGGLGESFSFEPGREVRRVELGTRRFFLKRNWESVPIKWAIRKFLRGQLQHGRQYYELKAIEALRSHGYSTMTPAAWGERRLLGFPVDCFLLTEEVVGESGVSVWQRADNALRLRYLHDAGHLTGSLHRDGFVACLRPKDVICPSVPSAESQDAIKFVQIDRELWRGIIRNPNRAELLRNLAKTIHTSCLREDPPSLRQMLAFCRAYLVAFGEEQRSAGGFLREILSQLASLKMSGRTPNAGRLHTTPLPVPPPSSTKRGDAHLVARSTSANVQRPSTTF